MTTLDDIRRTAVRGLFAPAPLEQALRELGFVQADPIRSPARAQDLTLRPRVAGYRAGDLDRHYAGLPVEEDVFIDRVIGWANLSVVDGRLDADVGYVKGYVKGTRPRDRGFARELESELDRVRAFLRVR